MADGYVVTSGKFIAFTDTGQPLAGGLVYTYQTGTSTPTPTWSDANRSVENSNPVVLDAAGRASIFIADAATMVYKFVVKTAAGVTVYTEDGISSPTIPAAAAVTAVPAGCILAFGGTVAPTGFLLCDGQAVSRATYADLFAIVGTAFGAGNGSSTFNVPNCQGRFLLGVAVSGTGSTLGGIGGDIDHRHAGGSHAHTLPTHTHPLAHTHTVSKDGWGAAANTPPVSGRLAIGDAALQGGAGSVQFQAVNDKATGDPNNPDTGVSAAFTSTNAGGTENTGTANPPFLTANYIIKY